jgi:hypothetical protein
VRSRLPVLLLALLGGLFLLAGAAGIMAGLTLADRMRAMLPIDVIVDAPAVGGAVLALGLAGVALGALHLGLAATVSGGRRPVMAAALMLTSAMAVATIASAVAVVISLASAMGNATVLVPLAIGLALLGGAYACVAFTLIGVWRATPPP